MATRIDKKAQRVKQIFEQANSASRVQWEYINQKGFDFSNDNQITDDERIALEEQGMPTFTINRIIPVVEMLNFYATANTPRWQAIGTEGSDTDAATVFSDIADYIWYISDGGTLYANAINDSITKSMGFLMVTVDPDADRGMGDVKITQPEPFDVWVDPKSRDLLFRDAGFIMCRKVLPRHHLMHLFPEAIAKIKKAGSDQNTEYVYSEKSKNNYRADFDYKDVDNSESVNPKDGSYDELLEYYEMYEKMKIAYMNVFYRVPPDQKTMNRIKEQVAVEIEELKTELTVKMKEQKLALDEQVKAGGMIPERMSLELKKAADQMKRQVDTLKQRRMSELQAEAAKVENRVVTEKEYKILAKDTLFAQSLIDAVKFYGTRIKQTTVVGDKTIGEKILPDTVTEYPIVPFHFKWTGTPYPMSAVSPLIGKQREMNKAHQLMVHNASLGSSLRFMHEEGSIDTDYWEKYSSSPGALLPVRPGATPPTPVQPMPLSNAFFSIVQEGKQDMEYLAGIYGAMQGDTGSQHETYRGMLALDEYGTRRVKQWLKNAVEPGLKQLGTLVMQFSQAVYTAHKTFRIAQPNALQDQKKVEINVPMYNDMGEAIGKFKDYATAKFDIRIVAGSTLPVNRWAYLDELKQLMQLGVIDDIALLAETDIKNKENIVKRKSLYAQLQSQIASLEEQVKNGSGTIETLERQLVQAGIKGKVMQSAMEINAKKNDVKSTMKDEQNKNKAMNALYRDRRKKTFDDFANSFSKEKSLQKDKDNV